MRERLKQAAQAAPALLLIGLWLTYEFRVITPADIPEDVRKFFSWPINLAGVAIVSAVIFIPTAAIAQWIMEKLGILVTEKQRKWASFAIAFVVAIWIAVPAVFDAKRPEVVRESKIEELEAMRRFEYASIARQEGECKAIAIEFNNDPQMNRICQDSLRMDVELAHQIISDINKRIEELRRIR